jgi:hypothetical protein
MTTRFRDERTSRAATDRARPSAEAARLGSGHGDWTAIVIGYLAAVLTSVGLMLALVEHGW